jgi:hypothetical protein
MATIVSVVNHTVDMVHLLLNLMVEIIILEMVVLHSSHLMDQITMVHHNLELVFHHNSVHNLLLHKVVAHKAHQVEIHQMVENAIVPKLKIPAPLVLLEKRATMAMMVLMGFLVFLEKMELMVNILKHNVKNMVNASLVPLVRLAHKDLLAVLVAVECVVLVDNPVFLAEMEIQDFQAHSDQKDPLVLLEKKALVVNPELIPPNSWDYPVLRVNKDPMAQLEISELPEKKAQLDNLVKKVHEVALAKMVKMAIMEMPEKPENLANQVLMQNIVHALLEALIAKLELVVKVAKMAMVLHLLDHQLVAVDHMADKPVQMVTVVVFKNLL